MKNSSESQQAARLLLERRKARRSLTDWSRVVGFEPALHHRFIIDRLEAVVRGEIKRLALFLPPGSAKSTYASILFPPWYLAQKPGTVTLSCSHGVDLAESFGRKCRNIISEHEEFLGYGLAEHSKAAGRWETTTKCEYMAAGVGTKIAGRRADLGLIDDPVGSKEDADSKLIRDRHWDWYNFDFKPRLKPGASIILIQTRWHEDDLAGRILEKEAEDWIVISLPFIAEENDPLGRKPGERLWSEWYTTKMEQEARAVPRLFSALYQQRPTPDEGDFFQKYMLQEYELAQLPKELSVYVGSDHAVSTKESADRTCIIPVGIDSAGDIWVLPDVWWKIAPSDETVEAMLELCKRRRPITWWAGRDHITQGIGPFLRVRMRETGIFVPMEDTVSVRDKRSRATSIRDRMAMGRVHFPSFASWWPGAKEELLRFTGNEDKHDDFVDALAEIGRGLDRLVAPRLLKEKSGPKVMTWGWMKQKDKERRRMEKVVED